MTTTNAYWTKVREVYSLNKGLWRYGQTCFNVLHMMEPALADSIRGGALDPYHFPDTDFRRPHWVAFQEFIRVTLEG